MNVIFITVCNVSIHAPARGATNYCKHQFIAILCFNPRTRTGCDLVNHFVLLQSVSFNPRTRTGCDFRAITRATILLLFQSTHPHGVRHQLHSQARRHPLGFNPRTRTGCDSMESHWRLTQLTFQSTHPHGVRRFSRHSIDTQGLRFQSTHPHGVRRVQAMIDQHG